MTIRDREAEGRPPGRRLGRTSPRMASQSFASHRRSLRQPDRPPPGQGHLSAHQHRHHRPLRRHRRGRRLRRHRRLGSPASRTGSASSSTCPTASPRTTASTPSSGASSPAEFERCLLSWITALHEVTAGQLVAIDGKTLRQSFDKATAKSALHMVSAWATPTRSAWARWPSTRRATRSPPSPSCSSCWSSAGAS